MSDDRYQRRGQEFADRLHERSRKAAAEHRKLLTSLATGAIGIYFIALTSKADPALSWPQTLAALVSILSMALAIVAGIFSWHADSQRNYYWAEVEAGKQRRGGPEFDTLATRWKGCLYISNSLLLVFFISGILASVCYVVFRIYFI